jgi:hypothetical protein
LPAKTGSIAAVWLEGDFKSEFDAYELQRVQVEIDALKGAFVFDSPLTQLPSVPVRARTGAEDADKQLLTWEEAVVGEMQAWAATALNKLHDELKKLSIKHDGSTSGGATADFFGIVRIADAAEINPQGPLSKADADEPLTAPARMRSSTAEFSSPFAEAAVDAVVRVEVELTRDGLLNILPRVDVPDLPHVSLIFPKVKLPEMVARRLVVSEPGQAAISCQHNRQRAKKELGSLVRRT